MRTSVFMTVFLALGMLLYWAADATLSGALAEIKPRVDPAYERFDHVRVLGENQRGGTDTVAIGYKEIVTARHDTPGAPGLLQAADAAQKPVTIAYADLFLIEFDAHSAAHTSQVEQLTNARSFTCLSALRHSNVDYVAWRDSEHQVGVGRITAGVLESVWTAQSRVEDRGGCPQLIAGDIGDAAAVVNFADVAREGEEGVLLLGLHNGDVADTFDLSGAFGPWAHLDVRSAYSPSRDTFYALWENSGNFYMGSVDGNFTDTASAIFRTFSGQNPLPGDAAHIAQKGAAEDEQRVSIRARKDGSLLLEGADAL